MAILQDSSIRPSTKAHVAFAAEHSLALPQPLLLFLLVQALAWTLVPAFSTTAPDSNTAEIAMWGREWFWVNYKHPALPSWSLDFAYSIFGTHLWVSYFVSQAYVCGTILIVFLLGRDLLGDDRGLAGALLLSGVSFFTLLATKFSHNVAQMPFWAGICFGLWRATETNKLLWWIFTAVMAALGIYAKFSTAMLIAFAGLWILCDPLARARLRSIKPYLALALFLASLAPLVQGLIEIDFLPIKWIEKESEGQGVPMLSFLFGQLKAVIGLLALPFLCGMISPRLRLGDAIQVQLTSTDRRRLLYLLWFGLGPLALTLMMSLFSPMRIAWTMPMFNLLGLVIVALVVPNISPLPGIRRLGLLAMVMSLGCACAFDIIHLYNRYHGTIPLATSRPMEEISERFDAIWATQIGRPLKIVGGEVGPATLAGLLSPSKPALFSEMDERLSPSMTQARVLRDGVLVLWNDAHNQWRPSADLLASHVHGVEAFQWSKNQNVPLLKIGYLIIPPGA